MTEFASSFGIRLRRAYRSLHRRANAELRREFSATADQFVILSLLVKEDGVSQRELGNRSYSDASTIGQLVRSMERRGWVRRDADPDDGRARRVRLTERGRSLQVEMWEFAKHSFHNDLWSVPRSDAEQTVLFEALDRTVEAMERGATKTSE